MAALPKREKIKVSADEINCLIYSYLEDSGFHHSAFSVRNESNLDQSPHFNKHIPRGELVELLCRALLYTEVETHFQSGHLASNCIAPFSLLERHLCEYQTQDIPKVVIQDAFDIPATSVKATPNNNEPDKMDVDPPVDVKPPPSAPTTVGQKKRGPSDATSDPRAILTCLGHSTEVFVGSFNPKKLNLLATGSKDGVVHIWDLPYKPDDSGFLPYPSFPIACDSPHKPDRTDVTAIHWDPAGDLLALACYDSVLRVFTSSGQEYFSSHCHTGPIFAVQFSADSNWLISASLDCSVCLWDVKLKTLHRQYRTHTDCCLDLCWLSNTHFASCGADHKVFVQSIRLPQPVTCLRGHTDEINQVRANSSGTKLASCSDDGTARVWTVDLTETPDNIPGLASPLNRVVLLRGHTRQVACMVWCPPLRPDTHEMVATSSFDKTVRLWDSVTGVCAVVFNDHVSPVYSVAVSPQNRYLASGSGDGWVHVYDMHTEKRVWSYYMGANRRAVFEVDWQYSKAENIHRLMFVSECKEVVVVDMNRIAGLH